MQVKVIKRVLHRWCDAKCSVNDWKYTQERWNAIARITTHNHVRTIYIEKIENNGKTITQKHFALFQTPSRDAKRKLNERSECVENNCIDASRAENMRFLVSQKHMKKKEKCVEAMVSLSLTASSLLLCFALVAILYG